MCSVVQTGCSPFSHSWDQGASFLEIGRYGSAVMGNSQERAVKSLGTRGSSVTTPSVTTLNPHNPSGQENTPHSRGEGTEVREVKGLIGE